MLVLAPWFYVGKMTLHKKESDTKTRKKKI